MEGLRGTRRRVSKSRQMIVDLMYFSRSMPLVTIERSMPFGRLANACQSHPERPPWSALFAKAFALVAEEIATLRRPQNRIERIFAVVGCHDDGDQFGHISTFSVPLEPCFTPSRQLLCLSGATHRRLAEPGCFVTGNRVLLSAELTTKVLRGNLTPECWSFVRARWLAERWPGVLHLWHRGADRSQLSKNERKLAAGIVGDRIRAQRGLSSLQGASATAIGVS
jgi:hypothetical protein